MKKVKSLNQCGQSGINILLYDRLHIFLDIQGLLPIYMFCHDHGHIFPFFLLPLSSSHSSLTLSILSITPLHVTEGYAALDAVQLLTCDWKLCCP